MDGQRSHGESEQGRKVSLGKELGDNYIDH